MIRNSGFVENFSDTWKFQLDLGATGTWTMDGAIKRNGVQSIHLSKTNSLGYLILSAQTPVRVEAGATRTLRFWFYAKNAQITSFLIPRLVTDLDAVEVANPYSALWVNYDYDSQSLMRNCPSFAPKDWIKRVVFYENRSDQPQDIFIQVAMYGNPFDVYLDDFEFEPGKRPGTRTPQSPTYRYTESKVLEILAERAEENAFVSDRDGINQFYLNGTPAWPIYYRGLLRKDADGTSIQDPAGFYAQGIDINNVFFNLSHYWIGPDKYCWQNLQDDLMDTLRKNPYARLLLDFHMDAPSTWKESYPDEIWETKAGTKLKAVSYSSQQWRKDGVEAIHRLVRDLISNGFWKIVVGANIVGGHDGQFWTKVIGEFAADYAPGNRHMWQTWLKERYSEVEILNTAWNSNFLNFNEIPIPDPTTEHETLPAIMARCPISDFRMFCEATAFDLRECFAQAIKEEAGKDIFISAYGMPMENQHDYFLKMADKPGDKANDMIASMSYYPYRQPGLASGYHPEQSFSFHGLSFLQELDLRAAFVSDQAWYDELSMMWCGGQDDIASWRNMHRKLVGASLALDQGFWYYDMDKQFIDQSVLDEIGSVKQIADKLVTRQGVKFRPDVCLVRFGAESRYYGSSVDSSVGATVQWQYMQLETSGVPYDIHYLFDIMAQPTLQEYKIYIFHNHTLLTEIERDWIDQHLKKDGRTVIWLYDSGYATEQGLSTKAISDLVGMEIATDPKYTRSIANICGNNRLVGGEAGYWDVPTFQGMAEALCGIFTKHGPASIKPASQTRWEYVAVPGVSRYQKFWVTDGYDSALACDTTDGEVVMAVRRFSDWTSIYIGTPNGLAAEMMNNIAQQASVYRCGPPSIGEMRLSGRFASYHALRSRRYDFRLPPDASRVIDPETGNLLAENVESYTIDGLAQQTKWFFIE